MSPVLAATLQSLQLDASRLERVASNLANAQMPGWRRAVEATGFSRQVLAAQGQDAPAASQVAPLRLDPRPGALRATGQPLDLALSGAGWFAVQGPDGLAYTRRGDFHLDAQGRLVTAQGHTVLGLAGEIVLAGRSPVIDAQGRVTEPGEPGRVVAQLRVVSFAQDATAQRLPDGLVRFAATPQDVAQPQVRQGWLENANVAPAHEMLQLMQVLRHAESLQKVATGWDELQAGAIRRLGEQN